MCLAVKYALPSPAGGALGWTAHCPSDAHAWSKAGEDEPEAESKEDEERISVGSAGSSSGGEYRPRVSVQMQASRESKRWLRLSIVYWLADGLEVQQR
ncbi:hypothetical protein HL42_4839 [Trichophyton rubrum]|nr:hypothetical protein HL42_4839 [Trichophyton rubrum]